MDKIILIKCNGFCDVIESTIEISDNHVEKEYLNETIKEHDDGIFLISHIKLYHFSGQSGEYGQWEIAPYTIIDDCKIKKLCCIYDYITDEEKEYIKLEKAKKRAERLQEYVKSFSTDEIRYCLCKLWGNSLEFIEERGTDFITYKTIHRFDNDSTSTRNIGEIKKWIDKYFETIN